MYGRLRGLPGRYRGGFPGDFWNRFRMEIITADLNDYLRIYLLPSVLAFLFVLLPSSGGTERTTYGFIIVHAGSFSIWVIPVCCLLISNDIISYGKHKIYIYRYYVRWSWLLLIRWSKVIKSHDIDTYHPKRCKYRCRCHGRVTAILAKVIILAKAI